MKKAKRTCVLEWIPMGMFPGFLMLNYQFTHKELLKILEKKEDAETWYVAVEDEEHRVNNIWCAMHRELENSETTETTNCFTLNIPETFDFNNHYHYCMLAHEVLHICQFYLPDVLDRNKEHEAEAYFHTYLMDSILKLIKK